MAHSAQTFQDEVGESPASTSSFGVDKAIAPALIGDESGEASYSELDEYITSPFDLFHEDSCTSNGLPNTSHLEPLSSIGAAASPIAPKSLLDRYYIAEGLQEQEDFSSKFIDPQLLHIPPASTLDTYTQPDLEIPSPPTSIPAAPYPRLPEVSVRRPRPVPSRGRKDRIRAQNCSPRHKKRRAEALEGLTQQRHYHCLPTDDWEYFDQVVGKLRDASYLGSPQSLEPTVGSADGCLLVGGRRLTGPGAARARESVYVILIDRPLEGDFVCWICGETRPDRRLVRALDHIRAHFNHRPYHCSNTHLGQRTGSGSASSPPLVAVCGQSFTSAEALKDHEAKMKNKSHSCDACEKTYTSSANLNRHMKKAHPN